MRITYSKYGIEQLIEENEVWVICIENRKCFSDIICDLWQQINGSKGDVIFSDGNDLIKINREVEMIFNPYSVDCNEKKILNALYQEIEDETNDLFQEEMLQLKSGMIEFMDRIIENNRYSLAFECDIDIVDILKLFSVKIDNMVESVAENLLEYIRIKSRLCKTRCFIFVNIKSYISNDEMNGLYEAAFYEKVHLILIENTQYEILNGEKITIIDKDLCFINLN